MPAERLTLRARGSLCFREIRQVTDPWGTYIEINERPAR